MATLVLSTVGSALGGPIGGVLGSLAGQSIDQQLLGGGARKGPRLGDLSVQSSSYGTPIPRIYGTMRVAGTIVWSTDLKEDSELQGDGKSQPEAVIYTYSVSFAVALSCREAMRVKRIWADGKLIRGAAGDLKVPCKFRFYPGSGGQDVDPAIEAIEGLGQAPAYRGLALAVFEDLQLATFGNRIPALTFEIVADEDVAIGSLLTDAGNGSILCTDARPIGGYAAHGDDLGSAIVPLVEAFSVELHDDGELLRSPVAGPARSPSADELGAGTDMGGASIAERQQAPASLVPASLAMTFYDPARDFQAGQVRVSSPATSRVSRALTVPCVIDAATAKAAAESLLLRAWALRERLTIWLPLSYADVKPGALIRPAGIPGDWIADEVEIARFIVAVTLRPAWSFAGSRSADPGRGNSQPDIVAQPTRMALFDLPDPETSQPVLMLAAASPSGNWHSVPVAIDIGGVAVASRSAAREAMLGKALGVLPSGQAALFDMVNAVEVQLANPDHWLQSRDDEAMSMGANLAAIGEELVQFGSAEAIGPGRFRLSKLLRGRRGSEWAMSGHGPDEAFCLLDARSLKAVALPLEMLGTAVTVTAHGVGDAASPPTVAKIANGEAMRPLSPAHLSARVLGDGSLSFDWVRRSRSAWSWQDEIEAPVEAGFQGYRVRVAGSSGFIERDVAGESFALSTADVSSLGPGPGTIEVRQIGAMALSRPAFITINL